MGMNYPICGTFVSKRGIRWNYKIYSDGTIEQWHSNIERGNKGYKTGRDTIVKTTKECKDYIEQKYGIKCKE